MQINELIQLAMLKGASDIHLSVGSTPTLRVNGAIEPLGGDLLKPDDLRLALVPTTREKERSIF